MIEPRLVLQLFNYPKGPMESPIIVSITGEEVGRILKKMMQHEPRIKGAGMTKGKLYWWEEPSHTRHVWCSHKLKKWVYDAEASEKAGLFRSKLSHCRQCGVSLAS